MPILTLVKNEGAATTSAQFIACLPFLQNLSNKDKKKQ
jgi:hypothetical protein